MRLIYATFLIFFTTLAWSNEKLIQLIIDHEKSTNFLPVSSFERSNIHSLMKTPMKFYEYLEDNKLIEKHSFSGDRSLFIFKNHSEWSGASHTTYTLIIEEGDTPRLIFNPTSNLMDNLFKIEWPSPGNLQIWSYWHSFGSHQKRITIFEDDGSSGKFKILNDDELAALIKSESLPKEIAEEIEAYNFSDSSEH